MKHITPKNTEQITAENLRTPHRRQNTLVAPDAELSVLHDLMGNRAVGQLIQAKLKIGAPDDKYEREADRIADQVMRMPEPRVERQDKEDEDLLQTKSLASQITPLVQRQAGGEGQAAVDTSRAEDVLRSPGQPLDEPTRAFMESRFGYDLGDVRVHTDAAAAESAHSVNARAYTLGHKVVFGGGHYTPGTSAGQRLLAHELVHVIQQRAFGNNGLQRETIGDKSSTSTELSNDTNHYATTGKDPPSNTQASLWWDNLPTVPTPIPDEATENLCEQIGRNRKQIPIRALKEHSGKGYEYTAAYEAQLPQISAWDPKAKKFIEEHQDYMQGVEKARDYQAWLANAVPSDAANGQMDPKRLAQWQTWKGLWPREGDPSSMNTYDRPQFENVTWGVGYASGGGQFQAIMNKLLDQDPGAKDIFYEAGITMEGNEIVVVDVSNHYKAKGLTAQRLIRFDPQLISLFINVAQGAFVSGGSAHRQAVLDIQFKQFIKPSRAGDIPAFALTWNQETRTLVAHNIHYGGKVFGKFQNPWYVFAGCTDLKTVVQRIAEVWGTIVVLYDHSTYVLANYNILKDRIKDRAGGIAMSVLEGPFEPTIIPTPPEAGPYDPNKPRFLYTMSFWFEADRVYFKAKEQNKYYRLKK